MFLYDLVSIFVKWGLNWMVYKISFSFKIYILVTVYYERKIVFIILLRYFEKVVYFVLLDFLDFKI